MYYVQSCVVRSIGYSVLVNDQIVEMYAYVYLHKRPSGITANKVDFIITLHSFCIHSLLLY